MGVIISAIVFATKSIKHSRDKKKATKIQTQQSPPPYSERQEDSAEGLRDEHPASVAPPGIGQASAGAGTVQVERTLGVDAPLPLAGAVKYTYRQESSNTIEGNKDMMASDEDYAAFLDKANEDPNKGVAKTQSSGKVQLKAVDDGVEVPAVLKRVAKETFYVSDADEPFEPVCLKLSGKLKGLPDEVTFAKLVNHPSPEDAEVEIMDIGEWDSQGQYKEVVDATREATKGSDVRVYRISRGGSRVEYFVVGVEGGKLVGVKALAIES